MTGFLSFLTDLINDVYQFSSSVSLVSDCIWCIHLSVVNQHEQSTVSECNEVLSMCYMASATGSQHNILQHRTGISLVAVFLVDYSRVWLDIIGKKNASLDLHLVVRASDWGWEADTNLFAQESLIYHAKLFSYSLVSSSRLMVGQKKLPGPFPLGAAINKKNCDQPSTWWWRHSNIYVSATISCCPVMM
jgi:hypothetical protein